MRARCCNRWVVGTSYLAYAPANAPECAKHELSPREKKWL